MFNPHNLWLKKFTKNSQFLHIFFTIMSIYIFREYIAHMIKLNFMKKVGLILLIIFQLFSNSAICEILSVEGVQSCNSSKDVVSRFFDVIRSAVDLSGLGNSIKNRVDDKKEEPVNSDNSDKGIYLVIILNNISSLTIIFLQSMLVFLGFVNLLKVRGYRVGGRRYILMFLLILYLSMYKFVYYAPRSSISDCVIYLISGVLISPRLGGMKLGSYLNYSKQPNNQITKPPLISNHQSLIPDICRFNSASWFFTPYHPLVPPYHEAGLNLLRKCGWVDV